jgi:hypothetical protein
LLALYLGYFRRPRLEYFGHSVPSQPTSRMSLAFNIRVRNRGVFPAHLKDLLLRNEQSVLRGKYWMLDKLEVDGEPFDLRRSTLSFSGGESRILRCVFSSVEVTPQGNVGIVFLTLEATEIGFFRERTKRPLIIQVSVGREFEVALPGSKEFLWRLYEEERGKKKS